MQIIVDILKSIDLEGELTIFVCSATAFLLLMSFRNQNLKRSSKTIKTSIGEEARSKTTTEHDMGDDSHYIQMDKTLCTAFENEDYWKVIQTWKDIKHFPQASIHLAMLMRSMRFCNKGAYFIVGELKTFFKTHPQMRSIGLINDLLEPFARRPEDAQLVDLLVRLLPTINISKDSRTYEILLTMNAASKNMAKAQETMAEMKEKHIKLSARAQVAALTLSLQLGDMDAVLEAFTALKPAWDERESWAVSMFALKSHKSNMLKQMVDLACKTQQICELAGVLEGMSIPDEVMSHAQALFQRMCDVDLATNIAVLQKSNTCNKTAPFYDALVTCSNTRCKFRPTRAWAGDKFRLTDSDASTSEGSRSDSEEEPFFMPPPGLSSPIGV